MKKFYLTDFAKGVIIGTLVAILVACVIFYAVFSRNKDKELIEYAEKQMEIELLREDIVNTPADEFLEVPDVRRAADGARGEFDRKRDEILERFRGGFSDR